MRFKVVPQPFARKSEPRAQDSSSSFHRVCFLRRCLIVIFTLVSKLASSAMGAIIFHIAGDR
jgi:hypothetical protein